MSKNRFDWITLKIIYNECGRFYVAVIIYCNTRYVNYMRRAIFIRYRKILRMTVGRKTKRNRESKKEFRKIYD